MPLGGYNKDCNRLFFFFAFENQRRDTPPANPNRVKVPTQLERQGDFSQSVDNNNRPYNLIRDYTTGLPCTATNTSGCFQDGGVLGRIPANRLYAPGLAILNAFPLPNVPNAAGYNFESQVAVEIDPEYTLAYSGLGVCYSTYVMKGMGGISFYDEAEAAA